MPNRKRRNPNDKTTARPATSKASLNWVGEVKVVHRDLPAQAPEDKRIHPRRPMPLIPEQSSDKPEAGTDQARPGSRKFHSKE